MRETSCVPNLIWNSNKQEPRQWLDKFQWNLLETYVLVRYIIYVIHGTIFKLNLWHGFLNIIHPIQTISAIWILKNLRNIELIIFLLQTYTHMKSTINYRDRLFQSRFNLKYFEWCAKQFKNEKCINIFEEWGRKFPPPKKNQMTFYKIRFLLYFIVIIWYIIFKKNI